MSQNVPVNEVKWVKYISEFNEDFIKSYIIKLYFCEVHVHYHVKLHNLYNDLPF